MGKVITRGRPLLNIATLNLSAYWEDYAGAPVAGKASAGTSATHELTEATNPPSVGSALNGHASADGDGANDQLLFEGFVADYVTADPTGSFSGWCLMLARAAAPAQPIYDSTNSNGPYNETPVAADTSGVRGLSITSNMGVGYYLRDQSGWKSAHALMPLDEEHIVTFRYDGATSKLTIGIDGPPNHSMYCQPLDNDLEVRQIKLFAGFIFAPTRLNGQIWSYGMSPDVWSDATFAEVCRTLRARFTLETVQSSNVEDGVYAGPHSPNAHTYETATVNPDDPAAYAERDGAILQFIPSTGKYWLFGGWRSNPYASWDPGGSPSGGLTTNEVWSSTDLIEWTPELAHVSAPPGSGAGARPRPRHLPGHCFIDGYWYIIGTDQYDPVSHDVWRTNNGTTWERRSHLLPWGRKILLCVGSYNDEIHVIGGMTNEASVLGDATSTHFRSLDGGVTWEQLPDTPFKRCAIGRLVQHGDLLLVIGGSGGGTSLDPVYANDTWAWDGSKWRQQSSTAPWPGAHWIDVVEYDDKVWVLGGRGSAGDFGGAWYTENAGQTWTHVIAPWAPTHADGVAVTDADGIVMASGFGLGKHVYTLKAA